MTFHSLGRCVCVLVLVRGLTMVGLIAGSNCRRRP
jgi:hypothetical protein